MQNKHPEAIFIQLHTYCNASCKNCPYPFTYKTIHPKGRMSDATWRKILKDIINMNYKGQVGFYLHHEPLLDKTLFDKIKEINNFTNAFVVLSTNGALLNQDTIGKLIEAKPKKVHININSGEKEEFEKSMGLDYQTTINNIHNFISQAKNLIDIEINCPVMKGYNVDSLKQIFPNTFVNLEYNANSRGGLIPELIDNVKNSRFKLGDYCKQPSQNFNILYDGSVISCCMDWMQESKKDFNNIHSSSIANIYNDVKDIEKEFILGNYRRYNMCKKCSLEMGFRNEPSKKKLKILLSTHHLNGYTGSEIFAKTLAAGLQEFGHDVTVYSKYLGLISSEFRQKSIKLIDSLESIKKKKFDIAQVSHNINAIEIRNYFPNLPIVFLSQGIIPFLEQPPDFDIGISKYLAISEEVKNNLVTKGIPPSKIEIIGNIIDPNLFYPKYEINEYPQKALILSGRIDEHKTDVIKEACNTLDIDCEFRGGKFGTINQYDLNNLINECDIVFSLGRGAIESMFCGRVPIIFDYLGGDGIVTPNTFDEIRKFNFSGRRNKINFTSQELVSEIKKYNKKYGAILHEKSVKEYSSKRVVNKLNNLYQEVIQESTLSDKINYKQIGFINNILIETRSYSFESNKYQLLRSLSSNINFNRILYTIEEMITKNNLESAQSLIELLLLIQKDNLDLLNNLAVIKIMQSDIEAAIKYVNQVLRLDPQNEIANENLLYINEKFNTKDVPLSSLINSTVDKNNKQNTNAFLKNSIEDNSYQSMVSIIIPVFNKVDLTEKCLKSIVENTSHNYSYEIIIVNNGSTDSTVEIVSEFSVKYPNIHLINLEKNLGFAKANNIASKRAKGKYLLHLNNDTEAEPNWLESMIELAENDSSIGAVGSKLLFPDNTVQHAGVLIYKKHKGNGTSDLIAVHNHYKKSPDDPLVNIPYEYQVLTAACLLIPKVLYKQLNGFDERFWNGYEDVDLCLRIRKAGFKLVYCPTSTLIHHESQSGPERFSKVPENVELLQKLWKKKTDFDVELNAKGEIIATNTNAIIPYINEITSIVIISYNNLRYLRETVNSVISTVKVRYELIIIDNNSDELTQEYLRELQSEVDNIKIIFNNQNMGFPNAVNTAIRAAEGSYITILNNDIVLTDGWLERMIAIAKMSKKVGIVGPVSNSVSGGQLIKDSKYRRKNLADYSLKIKSKYFKNVIEFPRVAFLCTLIKKEVIDKIGGLDERFSPGNFEDDDFCLRAQLAGYKTVIAQDVFIHHYGSKSFKANGEAAYAERMKINQQKFVDKWGADPNEIWLKGEKIKSRNIVYPVNNDEFIESFNRTLIHSEDSEFEFALKEIERAINTFDESNRKGYEQISKEELLNLAGNISLQLGDYEKSKDFFELELVENPNSGKACLGLAETFYKAELFEEAKTMYEWAIKNGENKNEVWNKLNSINQQLDLQENHNSLELSRENELPTIQQAEELINKSDLINAEKILRQILNSNPNNIDALNDYAVVHIMQNNYQPALEIINKVIQVDPSNEVALDNLKYIEQEVNSIN